MKTGDPKQAVVLGVVAFLAIGFVGSTAFKAIKQNSFSAPIEVKELRPEGETTPHVEDQQENASVSASTPVDDIFADAFTPNNTKKPIQIIKEPRPTEPKPTETRPTDPAGSQTNSSQETIPPWPPMSGEIEGGKVPTKSSKPATKPEKKGHSLRYIGFIESGSRCAIVSIDGLQTTVSEGDELWDGAKISSITSEFIKLKSGRATNSVGIGREKKLP